MFRASKCNSRILLTLCLFFFFCAYHALYPGPITPFGIINGPPRCSFGPEIDDIFVMVKTGACEDRQKAITQLQTSLRCVPSKAHFSDLEERFSGLHLHNAFDGHDYQDYKDTADEFRLYNRLQEMGSCGRLDLDDLVAEDAPHSNGNFQSRGWNLDKWKFLPMVEKTWSIRDNARWYLAIEPDTWIIWPNLLKWLSNLDSEQGHYIGNGMAIGDQAFSYGGSGSVLSHIAMNNLVDHIRENFTQLQDETSRQWAGDCMMGIALQEAGVELSASVHMNRDSVTELNPDSDWCQASVSFHHMSPAESTRFWAFQEKWFFENPNAIMRHRDIFRQYLLPQMDATRSYWDNLSSDEAESIVPLKSMEECERICLAHERCVQYKYSGQKCFTSNTPRLGKASESEQPSHSGWLSERVSEWARNRSACTEEEEKWSHD